MKLYSFISITLVDIIPFFLQKISDLSCRISIFMVYYL
nr:MAG TPA: hypothetical protein [Caudoviricetes sp.]